MLETSKKISRLVPITLKQVNVECYTYFRQVIPTVEGHIINMNDEGMKLEIDEETDFQLDDIIYISYTLSNNERTYKKKALIISINSVTLIALYFLKEEINATH